MITFLGQDVRISSKVLSSVGLTIMPQSHCEQSDIFTGQLQMSLVVHPCSLPLDVQEVCSRSIGQCVEQTKYSCSNVAIPDGDVVGCRVYRQLHNEGDQIQHSGHTCVQQLRQDPIDGELERLSDGEEVDEDPDECCDEADDGHEEEPVRAGQVGRGGAGHTHNAEQHLQELQYTRDGAEVQDVEAYPRQAVLSLTRVRLHRRLRRRIMTRRPFRRGHCDRCLRHHAYLTPHQHTLTH